MIQNNNKFTVKLTRWQENRDDLRMIREAVFIHEQHVPEELEWDDEDEAAIHVLAVDENGFAIGTGRLLADGHIGRMAVLSQWRGSGVGTEILLKLLHYCEENHLSPYLDAQTHATGFYSAHGFVEEGEEFMDAGIPHRRMVYRKHEVIS